jgi:hypothetical protein
MSVKYYEAEKELTLSKIRNEIDEYNMIIPLLQKRHNDFCDLLCDRWEWSLAAQERKGYEWVWPNYIQLNKAKDRRCWAYREYEEATKRYDALIERAKKNSNAE